MSHTPDLLATLEAIHKEAKEGQRKLREGEAVNGVSSLVRIAEQADDAVAKVRELEAPKRSTV